MRSIGQTLLLASSLSKALNSRVHLRTDWKNNGVRRSCVNGCQWSRRFATVFTSTGDETVLSTLDIKKFLNAQNIPFEEGYTSFIMECKLCCHQVPSRAARHSDVAKLFVNMTTGMFLCMKCKSSGTWRDLQDQLALAKRDDKAFLSTKKTASWLPSEKDLQPILALYNDAVSVSSLDPDKLASVTKKFNIESLGGPVLSKYGVRIKQDESELLFPIHSFDHSLVGCYVMSVIENKRGAPSRQSWVTPRFLSAALFGFKAPTKRQETIIITSTPIDVLALAQETDVPVVSLVQHKSLALEVLPLLESFKKIVLWLGNDVASWERSKMFANKLNERRCLSIRPDESSPTPLEVLNRNLNLSTILKSAHPVAHKAITTFSSLRNQVLAEFSHVEQLAGIQWKRYPLLTKLLKGHRRGELTVFTGSTGSGKTTFISDYSLDLCMQGVRTLWGSFEIRNTRLAKMMLTQFAEISLDKCLDMYDHWADQFEKLPLFFLTFHGPQNTRSVLDAMRHAVYVHDIEHVIVDNLQFMLGMPESSGQQQSGAGGDRYWRQDVVVSSFRQFATVHNCHVTLVIHPRKENSEVLNNMSIFGGAKASQEADNIMILQDNRINSLRGRKYIQVTKNRFDGDLGIVPLDFDRETLSFMIKRKPRKITKSTQSSPSKETSDSESVGEKISSTLVQSATDGVATHQLKKDSDSESEED